MYTNGPMSLTMIQARTDRRSKRAQLPEDLSKKLKSCSVLNCEEWRDLTAFTTYHCFPTGDKNQERWEIWTQLLRKAREEETWIPFRGSLVCSHHFRPEDFVNDPLSKRRKLIKNAIPSTFPTFTVDLEDPSYHLSASQGSDEGMCGYENENDEYGYDINNIPIGNIEEMYEYEYPERDGPEVGVGLLQHFMMGGINENAEDDDDDDIQIISDPDPPRNRSRKQVIANASTSLSPGGLEQIHILSTSSVATTRQNRFKTPQTATSSQNRSNLTVQSRSVVSSSGNLRQHHSATTASQLVERRIKSNSRKTSEEETANTINSLPFSLNPDLEIEIIDPTEDLAACRARINELEQENRNTVDMYESAMEDLKQNYEKEVNFLQQRIKEHERSLTINQIPHKKLRMS